MLSSFVSFASAIALLYALSASAVETPAQKKARQELEQQLRDIVTIPAPVAHVQFMGMDQTPFELTDVEFVLDGKPLPRPKLEQLRVFGAVTVFRGEVSHGDHVLTATVAYTDGSSVLYSATAGYTWRVTTKINFTAQRALETRLVLTPTRDGSKPPDEQFSLSSQITPVMLEVVEKALAVTAKPVIEPAPVEQPLSPPPLIAADVELPDKSRGKAKRSRVRSK